MFAPAYMGRKRFFQMLSVHVQGIPFGNGVLARIAEALERAAPDLFRPMYADANMGHPSRSLRPI
jgi:hypothetical protein